MRDRASSPVAGAVVRAPLPFDGFRPAGAGRAVVRVVRVGGRSVVSGAYATAPVRILTPGNHGTAAWVYTSSYGGGLVDGDRIALDVEVGAGAAALVSTQASTKIYRSPHGTSSGLRARVEPDGLLLMLPDPVVCFAGSTYRQTQEYDVAPGASLVVLDWMTSGRRASGERWAFDEYVARLSVRAAGRLLVHDAVALRAADGSLAARMGRFDVLGAVVLAGPALRAPGDALVSRIGAMPVQTRADCLLAAARLGDAGTVLRIAARSVEQAGRTIREHLGFVPGLLGDDPWARKW